MTKKQLDELDQEQFEKLVEQLEQFEEESYMYLAGSSDFEIVPTSDGEGNFLTREQFASVRKQLRVMGMSPLYKIDKVNGETMLVEPGSMRTLVFSEETH